MVRSEYRAAFAFLQKNKRLIFWVAAAFFAVILVATIACHFAFTEQPTLLEQLMRWVGELLDGKEIIDENGEMNAVRLFFANFSAVSTSIFYGIIPFVFLPVLTLLLNAWLIGVVSAASLVMEIPLAVLIASLLPHGIFELPALILGSSLGLLLCRSITRRILRRTEPPFLAFAADMLRVFVLVVLPLLVVAALIESHVTEHIAALFL